MHFRTKFAAASLLAAAGIWPVAAPSTSVTPPWRGPGAVLEAAEGILHGIEARDGEYLARAFEPCTLADGVDYALGASGRLEQVDARNELLFADVGVDGKGLLATSPAAAVKALLDGLGGKDVKVTHRVTSVHADCPGPSCSWGVVDFERTIQCSGGKAAVVPMRATLLARYRNEVPHMRVFGWHVSTRQ